MRCTKVRYRTYLDARAAMTKMAARGGALMPVRIYPCPTCKSLHITSSPKRKPR